MSLKYNPFDQTPKGNLVKRRRVFETPSADTRSPEVKGPNLSREPSKDNLETKNESIVTEQSSETTFENKVPEHSFGTNLDSTIPEPTEQANQQAYVTEQSSETTFENKVPEHSFGTYSEQVSSEFIKQTDSHNIVPEQSSETMFGNTVSEHNSETQFQNKQNHLNKVQESSSETRFQNKQAILEQVPKQISETKFQNRQNVLEQVPKQNSGPLPSYYPENPHLEENIDLSSEDVLDLTKKTGEPTKNFSKLIGLKKRIITFIYDECLKHKTKSIKTTYDQLSTSVAGEKESVRTTIKRLNKTPQSYFSIQSLGRGPGSQIIIRAKESDLREYMSYRVTNNYSSETKFSNFVSEHRKTSGTNTGTSSETPPSSSSSDINNKNITNTIGPESKRQDLSEDWLQIQTPENVKAIGFGQTQIKQLFQLGTLSASEVQESLEAFAYDLDVGGISSRGSKLAFLMGILRRSGAYISEGLVNELKVQVENNEKRRREMADLEKRQAQDKLTAKAQEIASHMTEREKLSLVPENGLVKIGSVSHERLVMAKIVEGLSKS